MVGYKNPEAYWNNRWRLNLTTEAWTPQKTLNLYNLILEAMKNFNCKNILEVGCGKAQLRQLPGYIGVDFAVKTLKPSRLNPFVFYADITKPLPFKTKVFDAALSVMVLLHVPPDKIEQTISEICRVTKKLVILYEPLKPFPDKQPHSFNHNLTKLFEHFKGKIYYIYGSYFVLNA